MSRFSVSLIACIVVALVRNSSASGTLETLTQDDKMAFLNAHNNARQAEGVGLNDLVWSDELAGLVEGLAVGCEFKHSSNAHWGENLMATSRSTISNSDVARQATSMWVDEKKYNDDGSFGCMYSSCGHYTQVVWGTTEELGCAVSHCSTWGLGTMVVCAYNPP
ncbi:pathogenesis-related protein 1 [Plakobranchus ocellatus]|uniref:Pathogenesis-related protein 1 n=1 Tax=Plakobranchus ocellatus TaxID=259542 RepID=A0AAV3ZDD3_9GAST|nr:pathogenesis-related protein 1 [Plakobranchus ocellatus]